MAVEVKVSPDERLEYKSVFLEDRRTTSQYFNLTELPDTFTGGKNAFLIAGTEYLEPNTEVLIQIRDAKGNIVYTESSDGAPTEYYEGISKVVAVYVYPSDSVAQAKDSTAFGPCTITILGELKYYDNNGIKTEVPEIWKGKYNVRYVGQATINPNLANTTRVRFFYRPQATITELLKPIYSVSGSSVSASAITASYANIKLSRLETFAGDVKRVKVYRTSDGTVSDYELIQDIQIEAKELLQTFEATGSVITDTGYFDSQVLSKFWNSGSLSATLDSTQFSGSIGVKLSGSGNFKYTSSLDLSDVTVYELAFDGFYTGSTQSNLEIHISGSQNGDKTIDTITGLFPTRNLTNYVSQFSLPNSEPNASLYFKQTQGDWYLKDISLRASAETVFSPNEVSFIVSMPTNVSNETFNFKFEFFDVNNNYIPVAVTGSQTFIGGNGNLSSIVYNVTNLSSSLSSSIAELSASVSTSLSSSYGTIYNISSSISNDINLVSGSIDLVSSSLNISVSSSLSKSYHYTDEVSASINNNISSSIYNAISTSIASQGVLIYSSSAYLEKYIFNNEFGKINRPPTASVDGLYLGSEYLGYYSQSRWITYMDNQGDFFLTSSLPGGNFLAWSSQLNTLQVQGSINVQGGNAATTSSVNQVSASAWGAFQSASSYSGSTATSISASNAERVALSASSAATTALLDGKIFTDVNGQVVKPPTVLVGSSNGLFIGSDHLGFYSGSIWRTYMDNQGKFYLTGSITNGYSNYLTWDGNGTLTIAGAINITPGGNAATQTYVNTATQSLSSSVATSVTNVSGSAFGSYSSASAYSASLANGVNSASASAFGAYSSASAYSASLSSSIGSLSGSTATSISASNALAAAYSASISASTAATTALLDGKIFTDVNGRVVKTPNTSSSGLYLGSANMGYYSSGVWRTYMDNQGKFYLTGSVTDGYSQYLTWDGSGTLTVAGNINITGGNAATKTYTDTGISTLSGSLAPNIFTNSSGLIARTPSASTAGLYLGSSNLGYYNGSAWKTYMDSSGRFYLSGAGSNSLTWDGTNLSIVGGGTFSGALSAATGTFTGALSGGTISIGSGDSIFKADSNGIYLGNATFASAPFRVTPGGALTATSATISGTISSSTITGNTITGGTISGTTFTNGGGFSVTAAGDLTATNATLTGRVNADSGRFGNGTNYWTIGASTVENNVTTNGKVSLNAARPAIEVYNSSGDLKIDINGGSTFTSTTGGSITPSGTTMGGNNSVSSGNVANGSSGASYYNSTQTIYSGTNLTFDGSANVGKTATIKITGNGTSGASSLTGTNVVGHNLSLTYGYLIRKGSNTGDIVATLSDTNSKSAGNNTTCTLDNYSKVFSTSIVLESATYYIVPFIQNISLYAYTSAGTISALAGTVYTPTISGLSISFDVGKTEIIAGGIQLIRDTNTYFKVDRAGSNDIVVIGGSVAVTGSMSLTGDLTANTSSDIRLKGNIKRIENPMEKISKITGNTFDWLDGFENIHKHSGKDVGVIAQEIENVLPEIVVNRDNGYKGVHYEKLVALLIEGMKELQSQIDELKGNK